MTHTQIEEYRAIRPSQLHRDPTFRERLEAVLPKGAEFVKLTSTYWGVQQGDEEMYVLYEGEEFVVYEEESDWAATVKIVLDFMDAESMKISKRPARLDEDEEEADFHNDEDY